MVHFRFALPTVFVDPLLLRGGRASRGRLAPASRFVWRIGFRAYSSRLARRKLLRGRCLGLLEGDCSAPFRGMDSAQRPELSFLSFTQRRLVRPPRACVIAPSEKRQNGKRNRNERNPPHAPSDPRPASASW